MITIIERQMGDNSIIFHRIDFVHSSFSLARHFLDSIFFIAISTWLGKSVYKEYDSEKGINREEECEWKRETETGGNKETERI